MRKSPQFRGADTHVTEVLLKAWEVLLHGSVWAASVMRYTDVSVGGALGTKII